MSNSGTRILIAEDSAIQAETLRRVLVAEGYSVYVAKDGTEGLLMAKEVKPELIISDILMPGMNGFELCRHIKDDPELGPTPVILLTSLSDPADVISGLECGADNFIVKPYEEHHLFARIKHILLNRELQEHARTQMGVEIHFAGKKYFITSEKKQILDLLISTYESAVQKNIELIKVQEDLRVLNEELEQRVQKRTGVLTLEIADRKRAENELKNSEKFIKDILSSVDEAFVVVDREYRILSANRAYCEQAGKPLDSIIGKHCYEISHHATQPCHEPGNVCGCQRTLETGEPVFTVHTHTDDNGEQRRVEIKTYAMKDESGGITSIIEVINDITEKTALENQLRHAQKMEGIGTLAGGIAHDFNNILSAIIGYGHVTLMKMPQDDPQRIYIEHILESADRAASLTQSLLAFSRKQIIDRKPVDLNNILRKVEKFLLRIIGEDVVVRLVLAEGALTIFGDGGQLEQVFMNLATNARDAMPNGGSFMLETSTMEVDGRFITAHGYGKPGSYAMLSATDTGVGMDEETRKKIFEPFFTTKEVGKGTGLGLAMVYGIIKQHEGFINVYSEPGKGTTFRIYLPLITAPAVGAQEALEAVYPKGGTETILLAEDDQSLRKLMVLVLKQMGYAVLTANDGEEAVAKFIENKDRIRLLLFDIVMPKKSGKEAYDEIRKMNPEVPVLFASGYSQDMLRERALIEKDVATIYKPISPQALLKKVREILDRK